MFEVNVWVVTMCRCVWDVRSTVRTVCTEHVHCVNMLSPPCARHAVCTCPTHVTGENAPCEASLCVNVRVVCIRGLMKYGI